MIRAVLNGGGRMARAIREAARPGDTLRVVAVASPERPDWLADENWACRLDELDAEAGGFDVLIDFSLPQGTVMAADWCARAGVPCVSGVTGLDEPARAALDRAAAKVPVLWAPNMSVGVNLLESLCRTVAATLGAGAAVHIHDVHHQWKKDAPSGTALALGAAVEEVRPGDAEPVRYTADREGEVIGEHTVRFEWGDEVLELRHAALDRAIFAAGAVDAAAWLSRQKPGRHHAAEWLADR